MTRPIRQSERFQYFEEYFNKYTAIMDTKSGAISDWNTGSDAEEEKKFLISCTSEEFDLYCAQIDKD